MFLARFAAVLSLALAAGVLAADAQTRMTAEELTVFPSAVTMGPRGQRALSVATRSGTIPPRVEWSISNPSVAAIVMHGASADIRALSAGRALVTARVSGHTVNANVTVEDADLRLGATRWVVPPISGLVPRPVLDASRVDDDGAEIFAVAGDPMKKFAVVRALTAAGTLVWQTTVRGTPWAGDRYGGLLVKMGALDQPSRVLARVDRPRSAVPSWRYRARGDIDDFGQADDGTIFLTIATHPRLSAARDENSQVVAIDGKTGLETGHFNLPPSTWQAMGACSLKTITNRRPSELGSLGEGTGGSLYAEMLIVHDSWSRACERGRQLPGRGRFKSSRELQLVRLTRRGLTAIRTLWRADVEGPDTPDRLRTLDDVAPGPIVETKSGDLIALRTHVNLDANGRLSERLNITRLSRAGEVLKEVVRPGAVVRADAPWRVLIDAPDTARVYFGDGATLQAIDLTAGTTAWSMDTAALPFEAIETHTVVANDATRSQVLEINYRGTVLRTFPARVEDARTAGGSPSAFHGVEPQTRALVEVQQPAYVETAWSTLLDLSTSADEVRRRFAGFLLETR